MKAIFALLAALLCLWIIESHAAQPLNQAIIDKFYCVNGSCVKDVVNGTMTEEQCRATCTTPPPAAAICPINTTVRRAFAANVPIALTCPIGEGAYYIDISLIGATPSTYVTFSWTEPNGVVLSGGYAVGKDIAKSIEVGVPIPQGNHILLITPIAPSAVTMGVSVYYSGDKSMKLHK